ncbi:RidA family protein [Nonomuraea sp. PA05]|uniref:RidA family protein n=1 Tax=Nonomuraea sp. PA05 TaxID=2604466 RepID=UPI0011D4D691|nr:RidA family protein [Nonomuraea sp. PA05]TYB64280.1 RidA family protein [Nonomuraea sp. PA05]
MNDRQEDGAPVGVSVAHGTVRLPALPAPTAAEAYARAASVLARNGLSGDDVVHVVEYVTPGSVAEAAGFGAVTVSRVPVERLIAPHDRVAVEVTAHPGGGHRIPTPAGVVTIAGDIVHLPTTLPADLTAPFRDQYRSCLETAARLLEAAGTGLHALVRTTDYTATATRADYPRCGRPRKELLGGGEGGYPGAAGILVDHPVAEGAMVSLDALASLHPLRGVNPGWTRYDTLTYQPGVAAGDTLFMSGFGALDPVTQQAVSGGDLLAQADHVYTAIEAVLREAGLAGEAVVRLVEYVTPAALPRYHELDGLRERRFPGAHARTSVVCSALLRPEFLIEVVPTAVFP